MKWIESLWARSAAPAWGMLVPAMDRVPLAIVGCGNIALTPRICADSAQVLDDPAVATT